VITDILMRQAAVWYALSWNTECIRIDTQKHVVWSFLSFTSGLVTGFFIGWLWTDVWRNSFIQRELQGILCMSELGLPVRLSCFLICREAAINWHLKGWSNLNIRSQIVFRRTAAFREMFPVLLLIKFSNCGLMKAS